MSNPDFVSVFADRFSDFVTFRRSGGVEFHGQIKQLRYFDRFLQQEDFLGRWPTADVVERYMTTIKHLHPLTRGSRFSIVRQFCLYLRLFEPKCFVPEKILRRERRPSQIPHIYSEAEIKDMLSAARELSPPDSLRPKTCYTLFGLLYTAGLRCGESFALNLNDFNVEQNLLFIRDSKFGKSRLVPISPSTSEVLQRYIEQRILFAPAAPEHPLFISCRGNRLRHSTVAAAFQQVLKQCNLSGSQGCTGARLHWLRHSFACNRLLGWYREGKDVNSLLPALATYLGHVKISSTQVYLRATAELLEVANQRFLDNFRKNISANGGPS
jgi:site-specific recombinase XerD